MNATTTMDATVLKCEKCATGTMASRKLRRFSTPLVVIGYTLWVPAAYLLLAVLFATSAEQTSAGSGLVSKQPTCLHGKGGMRDA